MAYKYYINEWAEVRRDEVIRLPDDLKKDGTFSQVWNIFIKIYDDIAKKPEDFGMPLYSPDEYGYGSKQAGESRQAPYRPFILLYNIFITGELKDSEFIVNEQKFKDISKVKHSSILLKKLPDYGFEISWPVITYPDNTDVLTVLYLMAAKAKNINRIIDFCRCHYKLLNNNLNTADYENDIDTVADLMHTKEEREFIYKFDSVLTGKGYYKGARGWNEGPGCAYYKTEREMEKKGPYHYWLLSYKTKLKLFLRIRNVTKCLDYLKKCPDSVKEIFLHSDPGCKIRENGLCKHGVSYELDGKTYWKCGCCSAPVQTEPKLKDIAHYINLLELGLKK